MVDGALITMGYCYFRLQFIALNYRGQSFARDATRCAGWLMRSIVVMGVSGSGKTTMASGSGDCDLAEYILTPTGCIQPRALRKWRGPAP